MDEKTMNASKKNILLRSLFKRTAVLVMAIAVVLFCVSPALAASSACVSHITASDYISSVEVSGDVKSVTYGLPINEDFRVGLRGDFHEGPLRYTLGDLSIWGPNGTALTGETVFPVYPLGFGSTVSLADLRVGSELEFTGTFSLSGMFEGLTSGDSASVSHLAVRVTVSWFWFDKNCNQLDYESVLNKYFDLPIDGIEADRDFSFNWSWTVPDEAVYAYPRFDFRLDVSLTEGLSIECTSLDLSHDVNMLLDNSNTMHRVEEKIEEIGGQLDDIEQGIVGPGGTNDKLEDIGGQLDDIEQGIVGPGGTNDKLEDIGGSLETLPGEIGDQIQGVIDNEKQEAEQGGNKFVDQLLDLLPDPSTGVLASLQGLTNATSYTGTEAKLALPSLKIPAVGGLVPETVLWEGGEMDFGEYFEMLPPTLLTLVRSLFTIAIVLYCVYELKGIISFVFTLKGGGQ